MCGFCGYLGKVTNSATSLLSSMGDTIVHRGPDDSGIWHDNEAGVGLAHRRLGCCRFVVRWSSTHALRVRALCDTNGVRRIINETFSSRK